MFQERQVAFLHGTEIAAHGKVKIRIIRLDRIDESPDLDLGIQFLADLPGKRLLRRLAGFYLAARKFPLVLEFTKSDDFITMPRCRKSV